MGRLTIDVKVPVVPLFCSFSPTPPLRSSPPGSNSVIISTLNYEVLPVDAALVSCVAQSDNREAGLALVVLSALLPQTTSLRSVL